VSAASPDRRGGLATRIVGRTGDAAGALARWSGVLLSVAMGTLFVITPLDIRAQAILGGVVFVLALVLNRVTGRSVTLLLTFISIAVSTRYMVWRVTATVDEGFSLANFMAPLLLGAELYTFALLLLGYLQTAWPLRRKAATLPEDTSDWPSVDVFIPSYNEPLKVVRPTVLAAMQMDWPRDKLRVHILDDGRRPEFRAFAASAHVGYLTRPDNAHAKAGNINAALKKTSGDLVAIFDCDHVPTRSFLQMTVGWFTRDPKVALVQTPHHFHSPDPFERNLDHFRKVPNEGSLFYGLIQPGNDLWDAVFFCGSCAVLRRGPLEEVGGIAVETVTEDAHTALRLHRKGYKAAYIDVPQASGLATESLSAHVGQRIRWARGMVQIFRIDNPLFGRGLSLAQRLCYANAMIYFLHAIPRLIFLTAPLAFLILGSHIFNATPLMVLAYAGPHLAHLALTSGRTRSRYRHSHWAQVYEAVLSFYILIPTTLALIMPRLGSFNVTAKGGKVEERYFDWRIAVPVLVILGLNLFGIGLGGWHVMDGSAKLDAFLINVFWASLNVVVLSVALGVAWERRQTRETNRVPLRLPVALRLAGGATVSCRTTDLSLGGVSLDVAPNPDLEPGSLVSVGPLINHEEIPIPGRVIGEQDGTLRVRFETLTLEEERRLVRILYSRANAWTSWDDSLDRDRPMLTAVALVARALAILARTAGVPFALLRRARSTA